MSLIRATILALAVPALLALACSDSPPPGGGGDAGLGGAGVPGTGTGGTTGGTPGVPGTGGSSAGLPGTGGTTGGTPGTGGTSGPTPPFPLPDGGLPNLDAGLPGLIDAGVVTMCPAAPAGKTCGGQGSAIACVIENSMPQQGCVCLVQRWVCGGADAGLPGGGFDAGLPIGQPPAACPSNAMGMTCPMLFAVCTGGPAGTTGCLCAPGAGGALAWICR